VKHYFRLIRPRILALVLLATAAAAFSTGDYPPSSSVLGHLLLGTGLVVAGAVAMNARLELRSDAMMARTADRPLPAGKITERQAVVFGWLATGAGLGYLAFFGNGTLFALAAVSWAIYVGLYTPLKSRSAWQTPVGAVAGAMPVLLGATAVDAAWRVEAWVLFGIVVLWQLPHAMAIAWLYRHQFAAAGVKLAPSVDPSGRLAGAIALLGAGLLLPLSLAPWVLTASDGLGTILAGVLGTGYFLAALLFTVRRTDWTARWLLRASLVYLPALLGLVLL